MNIGPYEAEAVGLAMDLINTYGWFEPHDDLSDAAGLAAFCAAHGVALTDDITRMDLERVRAARHVLYQVFFAEDEESAANTLNTLLAEAHPLPRLARDDSGSWHMSYADPGAELADRIVATAAAGLLFEIRDHGLARMGICAGSDCDDAFVDISRNHSKRYCTPEVCGNRAAVRAYRARKARGRSSSPAEAEA